MCYVLVTFYNALGLIVIHSLILFGSVLFGCEISRFDGGRVEKIANKAGHAGKPLDCFKTLCTKRLYKKTNANMN